MRIVFSFSIDPPKAWGGNGKRAFVRGGRAVVASKPATLHTRAMVEALILSDLAARLAPEAIPLAAPVSLVVTVTWPYSSSHSKRQRQRGPVPKTTRPDGDNVMKTIKDALQTCRVISDDAHIWEETIIRLHGPDPGIKIVLESNDSESERFVEDQ